MRIGGGAKVSNEVRERLGKIFVIADAETVALHDDVAAETGWIIVERDDGSAFFGREDWIGDGVAAAGERFARIVPVNGIDSFLDRGTHDVLHCGGARNP